MPMADKVVEGLCSHAGIGDINIFKGWKETKRSQIIVQQWRVSKGDHSEGGKLMLLKKNPKGKARGNMGDEYTSR